MPKNKIDLQIQSTSSDGKHSPREIVKMAKDLGLEVISLTDHDTVDGVREALIAGGEFGVRVIPGIEMSAEEHNIHILGYGIDYKNKALLEELEKSKIERLDRAKKMMENLEQLGFIVEWEDILKEASGGVVARPHLSRAVMKRSENKDKLGSIATDHDFIDKYICNECEAFVAGKHIASKDAIELIHHAGGVAVWSHPAIHFRIGETHGNVPTQTDHDGLEKFLQELIKWDLDGLEVFNPSHTEDDAEFIQSLALKHNLIRTAGSDFHEKGNHPRNSLGLHSADFLGDYKTHGFSIEDVMLKLDEAIDKRRVATSQDYPAA